MKYIFLAVIAALSIIACSNRVTGGASHPYDEGPFTAFETRFMDAYWQQHPSAAIFAGYGKYYENLKIPDSASFAAEIAFARRYLDSLHTYDYIALSPSDKIDYNILENHFNSTIWYVDTFKIQQWDPSAYNLGSECFELLNKKDLSLAARLRLLSSHLAHTDRYFQAALEIIHQPTREYTLLAVRQNEGSLQVFDAITDSVQNASLTSAEKDSLLAHVRLTVAATKGFVAQLNRWLSDKRFVFRDFRIGETLFNRKFHYDIVTDFSATDMFDKAVAAKNNCHRQMYQITESLWPKYFAGIHPPADSLAMIKMMIDKISLNHLSPQQVFDTLQLQVHQLEKFIIEKNLFDYDTTSPLIVQKMPAYMSGTSIANASGVGGPYDQQTVAYYNVSDLTAMPAAQAESNLREHNHYTIQILSIHEAMPGHCLQGDYALKSPSVVKSVFGNGAMIEGWAVYCQKMMLDNGWADNAPEMWLMFYKWSLRECCNVIVDYGLQCLHYSKEEIVALLKNEAFQEDAQIEEKYHRATISQVQLCSYFTGATEINALLEAYRQKMGSRFTLKDFHEKFLSYGSAPVKYIRALMLE